MTRREGIALGLAFLIMGAGAGVLRERQAAQRLGVPGVKVVSEPAYGEDRHLVSSNSVWLPARVLDLNSSNVPVAKIVEEWLPKDTVYGHRRYRGTNGFEVDQSVVLMGADRSSIHQPQYCLAGSGWAIEKEEYTTIRVSRPYAYDLPVCKLTTRARLRDAAGQVQTVRGLYVYWFVADNQLTGSHKQMQWWIARDLLRRGVLERWAYVACMTYGLPGQEEALFRRLGDFIAAGVPEFQLAAGRRLDTLAPGPRAGAGGG